MKTKAELEKGILDITMKIQAEFSELSKYIAEIPVKIAAITTAGMEIDGLRDYYNSLNEILYEYSKTHLQMKSINGTDEFILSGYPLYPTSDDIYVKGKKEIEIDPENINKKKPMAQIEELPTELNFEESFLGYNLDVPGSELDDEQEEIGSEDEENNYYSLGGDDHNDLEERNNE